MRGYQKSRQNYVLLSPENKCIWRVHAHHPRNGSIKLFAVARIPLPLVIPYASSRIVGLKRRITNSTTL